MAANIAEIFGERRKRCRERGKMDGVCERERERERERESDGERKMEREGERAREREVR